jgi:site-specific DNA-cytosine methylase
MPPRKSKKDGAYAGRAPRKRVTKSIAATSRVQTTTPTVATSSTSPPTSITAKSPTESTAPTTSAESVTTTRRSSRRVAAVNYSYLEEEVEDPSPKRATKSADEDFFHEADDTESEAEMSVVECESESSSETTAQSEHEDEFDQSTKPSKRAKLNNGTASKLSAQDKLTNIESDALDELANIESDAPDELDEILDDSDEENTKKKKKKKKQEPKDHMKNLATGTSKHVSEGLPPLHAIGPIFDDIVEKALQPVKYVVPAKKAKAKKAKTNDTKPKEPEKPEEPEKPIKPIDPALVSQHTLHHVLEHLGSHSLRVATMCSGTESPILAMLMINESLKRLGLPVLHFDHVFSAEIVPFKQAYIERNFNPPVIFRDITEITKSEDGCATTAYGGKKPIPGDIDLLIAGTACVDFSALNNKKKAIDQGGESSDTFQAVLDYAVRFKPAILVLENVYNAPWNRMLAMYESIGYTSAGVLVDTKNYYLPQTRQRGYMVCFRNEGPDTFSSVVPEVQSALEESFRTHMGHFRRQVSAPVSSFLLPSNDPVVIRAKAKTARQTKLDPLIRDVDWSKCEIRHINYRREHELGDGRPLTEWQESGTLVLPEGFDLAWFMKQVERVWDFIDMSALRKAHHSLKALPKNATAEEVKEATTKAIKGLERDYDVLFKTRIWDVSQNIDRFGDQAPFGIAPCLTPSGSFYITDRGGPLTFMESLIIQGLPLNKMSFTTETERNIQDLAGNAMSTTVVGPAIISALISGFELLPKGDARMQEDDSVAFVSSITPSDDLENHQSAALPATGGIDLQMLIADASSSASKCICEGQIELTQKSIQTCDSCGHTSCITCGVKPSHHYLPPVKLERGSPQEFIKLWRPKLPMMVMFNSSKPVKRLQKYMNATKNPQKILISKYLEAVENALKNPLAFKGFRRGASWTVSYESSSARLELVLSTHGPMWKLYAKAADDLSKNSNLRKLRRFLQEPVATSTITGDTLFGDNWSWRVYENPSTELSITGKGQQVRAFGARLGIPAKAEDVVWSELVIDSSDTDWSKEVQGEYRLLPHCGTASESMYKRVKPDGLQDMFLFLDPTRIGNPKFDHFVFASDPSRLEYDQTRDVLAHLDSEWKPELLGNKTSKENITSNGIWVSEDLGRLEALDIASEFAVNRGAVLNAKCHQNTTATTLRLALPSSDIDERLKGSHQIQADDKPFFDAFGWALEPLRQDLQLSGEHEIEGEVNCNTCAPPFPDVRWHFVQKGKVNPELRPYEDPKTAINYEVAIKSRPEPFIMECVIDGRSFEFSIGINIRTLCERANGKLVRLMGSDSDSVTWSLQTDWLDDSAGKLATFTLRDNDQDSPYEHKVLGDIDLFEKQQRSLTWMLAQERGIGFVIKEVAEALLPYLGWRLEALASSEVHVKGGILADHAGFGKTITSLALIHTEWLREKSADKIVANMADLPSKQYQILPQKIAATLVVCPSNLVHQWAGEIQKHLPSVYSKTLLQIPNMGALRKCTVAQFRAARIIVVSNSIFSNESYYQQLASFTAMPESGGNTRATEAWIRKAAPRVPLHLDILEKKGAVALGKHLKVVYADTLRDGEYLEFAKQSKRFKGQQYVDKKANTTEDITRTVQEQIEELKKLQSEMSIKELNGCLLFEMFHFNRLIVDEFSYLDGKEFIAYRNMNADKRWGLSATPQLRDTYDVAKMAQLLGLKLPIGANAPGLLSNASLSALRKDMTNVEQFETFRDLPSSVVQQRMQAMSQEFLDTFVRQNVLKFEDSPFNDLLVPIILNTDHRMAYTNLSRNLNAQSMRVRKKDLKGERGFVFSNNLEHAEELLVNAAALYKAGARVGEGLDVLIEGCEDDCIAPRASLEKKLQACYEYEKQTEQTIFRQWIQHVVRANAFRDQSVAEEIAAMSGFTQEELDEPVLDTTAPSSEIDTAASSGSEQEKATKKVQTKLTGSKSNKRKLADLEHVDEDSHDDDSETSAPKKPKEATKSKKKAKKETEAQKKARIAAAEKAAAEKKMLTGLQSVAITAAKRYAPMMKTLRLVKNAAQCDNHASPPSCSGSRCKSGVTKVDDLAISAACGHIICTECYQTSTSKLGLCPVEGCGVRIGTYDLLTFDKLGTFTKSAYGSRADRVVDLLHGIAQKGQQAILFVQYDAVIMELGKILTQAGISHYKPNASGDASDIKLFQENKTASKKTVLILKSSDVSAAGTNLTNANHVIFFSPLLEGTQYKYQAQMNQGIGRVRRPGQLNTIYVYRVTALDTIDVDILEHRERDNRVLHELEDFASPTEMKVDGTDFEGCYLNDGETSRQEKMQLIRDKDDKIKLVPRGMLLKQGLGNEAIYESGTRIMGYEKFNSLVHFSRHYIGDEN